MGFAWLRSVNIIIFYYIILLYYYFCLKLGICVQFVSGHVLWTLMLWLRGADGSNLRSVPLR
jgi:hypothetical protein